MYRIAIFLATLIICLNSMVQAEVLFHESFSNNPFGTQATWLSKPTWGSGNMEYDPEFKCLRFSAAGGGGVSLETISTTQPVTPPYTISLDFLCTSGIGGSGIVLWAQKQLDGKHYSVNAYAGGNAAVEYFTGGTGLTRGDDGQYEGLLHSNIWYRMILDVEKKGSAIELKCRVNERDTGKSAVPECKVFDTTPGAFAESNGFGFEVTVQEPVQGIFRYISNFAVYRGDPPVFQPGPDPVAKSREITADIYQFPSAGVVEFHFTSPADLADPFAEVECKIIDSNNRLIWHKTSSLESEKCKLVYPGFGKLAAGTYTLEYTTHTKTGSIKTARKDFHKSVMPVWLNNSLGRQDIVPAPWTPVKISGRSVFVWGREYRFAANGLLESIRSQKQNLLVAPVKLISQISGKSVALIPLKPLVIKQISKTRASVTALTQDAKSGLKVQTVTTVEFDGFARVDITISGKPGSRLDKLWLEYNLTKENALYHLPVFTDNVMIPEEGLKRPVAGAADWAKLTTSELYWVGGDDVGLTLACEDDRGWISAETNAEQELVPGSNGTTWRYRFVDDKSGLSLSKPTIFTYMFMATPVKPVRDWYGERVTSDAGYGMDVAAASKLGIKRMHIHEPWTEIMGYPGTFANIARYTELQKEFNQHKMTLCLYSHPVISSAAPEFEQWGAEWAASYPMKPAFSRGPGFGNMLNQNVYFTPQVSSWADFYIYNWVNLIKQHGANGVYLDGTFLPVQSANPYYKRAYRDNKGNIKPTNPIFAAREFMKRWYIACKSLNPDFFFLGHMGDGWFMPTASFLDYSMGGEGLGMLPAGTELPWARWRAADTGRQFGLVREFYTTTNIQEPYALPLALLHGSSVYGRGSGDPVKAFQKPVWDIWDTFGISKAKWTPYWKNTSNTIISSNPDVNVSYYSKPHEVLVITATNKRIPTTGVITIDMTAIGLDPVKSRVSTASGPLDARSDANGKLSLRYPEDFNAGWPQSMILIKD